MASQKRWWPKVGRYLTGLVVVCFFLPFFGISCSAKGESVDIITMSGADMVGGCKPGGVLTEMQEQEGKHGGHGGSAKNDLEINIEHVDRELLAVVALAFCVTAFALCWLRTRGALIATFVVALGGLGSLVGLYVQVKGKLTDAIAEAGKNDKKMLDKDMTIGAGGRMGLWLVGGGLLLCAGLTGRELAMKDEPEIPKAQIAG